MRKVVARMVVAAAVILAPLGAQQQGYLKTKVNPGRAGVFVDGKYVGPAANFGMARKYAVVAGEHEIKLVDPRYEDVTKKVTVTAGKTVTVSETMKALPVAQPPFGRIRTLSADRFAAVYLNDKYVGHVDEFSNGHQWLLVPPGDYTIRIVPATGSPVEQKIKVEANKDLVVGSHK